jgi:hypothetical protein
MAARWGVPREPFKLDPQFRDQPSVYVVELVLNGVRHTYGFEVDDRRVLEEWLYSYPEKNRRRVIFSRSGDKIKMGSTMSHRQVAQKLTVFLRPEHLFLSLVGQLNIPAVNPVYRWFLEKLVFRLSGTPVLDESGVAGFLRDSADVRSGVVKLLQAADVGVSGLAFEAVSGNVSESERWRVRLEHGDSRAEFELAEESAGTRAWLGILPTVLSVLRDGGTLVVDEIDSSLHPLIVTRLVGLFHDREANLNAAQLLFSTHDATLLRPPWGIMCWTGMRSGSSRSNLRPEPVPCTHSPTSVPAVKTILSGVTCRGSTALFRPWTNINSPVPCGALMARHENARSRRVGGRSKRVSNLLVYCASEKTELEYFVGLRNDRKVAIKPKAKRGSPLAVVNHAADEFGRYPGEYESVWCVVDVWFAVMCPTT